MSDDVWNEDVNDLIEGMIERAASPRGHSPFDDDDWHLLLGRIVDSPAYPDPVPSALRAEDERVTTLTESLGRDPTGEDERSLARARFRLKPEHISVPVLYLGDGQGFRPLLSERQDPNCIGPRDQDQLIQWSTGVRYIYSGRSRTWIPQDEPAIEAVDDSDN